MRSNRTLTGCVRFADMSDRLFAVVLLCVTLPRTMRHLYGKCFTTPNHSATPRELRVLSKQTSQVRQ